MKKRILYLCLVVVLSLAFALPTFGAPTGEELLLRAPTGEDLLSQVPSAAYIGDSTDFLAVSELKLGYELKRDYLDIFFAGLKRDGVIPADMESFLDPPTKDQMATLPKVSAEDLCTTFDRLFGENASSVLKLDEREPGSMFGNGTESIHLLDDGKTFVYLPHFYGGGNFRGEREAFLRSETVDGNLLVYCRFAYFTQEMDSSFVLYDSVDINAKTLISVTEEHWNRNSSEDWESPWDALYEGVFDEYLPVYVHTFKPNGDGTYYWSSTQVSEEGKKIPGTLLGIELEELPTDTSSTESEGKTTDTSAAELLQTTSGTASDLLAMGGVEESNSLALWVAGGALVALCAVALVIFLKKK